MPLSVLAIGGMLTLGFLGIVRFRSRLFSFHRTLQLDSRDRVLILGTGKRAAELARSLGWGPYSVNVVGFVSSCSSAVNAAPKAPTLTAVTASLSTGAHPK